MLSKQTQISRFHCDDDDLGPELVNPYFSEDKLQFIDKGVPIPNWRKHCDPFGNLKVQFTKLSLHVAVY